MCKKDFKQKGTITHGELDPTQQTERRNVSSQVTLHLLCVYHFKHLHITIKSTKHLRVAFPKNVGSNVPLERSTAFLELQPLCGVVLLSCFVVHNPLAPITTLNHNMQ